MGATHFVLSSAGVADSPLGLFVLIGIATVLAAKGRNAAQFGWPNVMRLSVACQYTSRSRWTLQRAVARGELVAAGRQGRSLTFRREDLDRWLLGALDDTGSAERSASSRSVVSSTTDALDRLRRVTRGGAE